MSKNLDRRSFLKNVGMGAGALALGSTAGFMQCSKRPKPNIVIIFTDDQGYADVGCFGAKGFVTPNLDRMAEEGMRFTSFYVSQAVCSASRASLLTGCYSERVSIRGALMPWARIGLNPEEETIAEVLKKVGYRTAMFGKWHLGHYKEFLPPKQGFDEYLGLPYSNDMWPVDFDGKPVTSGWKRFYPPLALIDGDKKVGEIDTLDDQAKLTTLYTQRAVQFIEKNKDRPFFLYLAHSMPHVPLGVSGKFRGKSAQGLYGDVIEEIDWSVGQVLETLKKHNLDENTLVIFTSDNGPWLNFGNHAGSALPLREGKGTAFEGGVREPCIMRWPGHIPAGSVCNKIASTIDLLPTLAAITGAPLPKKKIDGVNILPLLQGKSNANPRDTYFYYYGQELRAVRQGKWKLFFPHKSRSYQGVEPGRDGYPGPYATLQVGLELYDLENDISETTNVVDQHPDVVARLQKLAEQMREELGDRLTKRKGKGVREPGRIHWQGKQRVKHIAVNKKIALKNQFSPRYAGHGASTLVDGIRGSQDFDDGQWLGFEADDFEAWIDLGKAVEIRQVSTGFLEDQNSWIFMPLEVEVALSLDDKEYHVVKKITGKTKINPEAQIKDFTARFAPQKARFVRIRAKNVGTCPNWHQGAGGKAWLFVDEIMVE